jgi:hypothetical protein
MHRRAEYRPFSWINDLSKRKQLDLSPPYQRRSVWPDRFRKEFITTALLNYPCSAIFCSKKFDRMVLFYKVIDGKQRITTLLDFVCDEISIGEDHPNMSLRGLVFSDLSDDLKLGVWRYAFSVEFVEQENEAVINDIFNRINKNVAKLSPQELRHARFSGAFISACENAADEMQLIIPPKFPNIASQSHRQMKDVENVATLVLFIENGERSISQVDMDKAFADRDDEWLEERSVVSEFKRAIEFISNVANSNKEKDVINSRLRNQADFYSLFDAAVELEREGL